MLVAGVRLERVGRLFFCGCYDLPHLLLKNIWELIKKMYICAMRNEKPKTLLLRGGEFDSVNKSSQSKKERDFDSLYLECYRSLCAYALRYVSIDEAEEIVQDTMLWLWDNWETIVPKKSVRSLLFRIVHNKAVNCIKHKAVLSSSKAMHTKKIRSEIFAPYLFVGNDAKMSFLYHYYFLYMLSKNSNSGR